MTSVSDNTPVLPACVETEEQLDDLLTRPSPALMDFIRNVASPLIILGAGGKMGPTLAVLARRAADAAGHPLEVIAVSRFGDATTRGWLESRGVRTLSCDLLEAGDVRHLPETSNLIYLVGLKFGTAQNPSLTWAMNTIVPARVAERYPRARIVALSTGNVYSMSEPGRGGSLETDPLTPLGEYPNAAVARERIFEYYARRNATPLVLLRLFYAMELRYGVLVDLARLIWQGQPVPLANGYFNGIWQADANEMVLRALSLATTPPAVYNLCRPEIFSVREMATRLCTLLNCPPRLTGSEAPTALLGNAHPICKALGPPATTLDTILPWVADWVKSDRRNLGKPTHFEVRDGQY